MENTNLENRLYNLMILKLKAKYNFILNETTKIKYHNRIINQELAKASYDFEFRLWMLSNNLFLKTAIAIFNENQLKDYQKFYILKRGIEDGYMILTFYNLNVMADLKLLHFFKLGINKENSKIKVK